MSRFVPSCSVLLLLALAACAPKQDMVTPTTPPASAATPAGVPASGEANSEAAVCAADGAQSFVGKAATEDTIAAARVAANATGAVRVIKPGQPVTMDYRQDRLNIEVDDGNMIVKLTCG